ncbi:MAG: hypothetical protein N2663_07230, partial [Chlorobi bacterium]|nr:hypothetical protein [Chlorobiota bacterium]
VLRITAAELIEGSMRTNIRHRFPDLILPGEQLRIRIVLNAPQKKRDAIIRVVANDTLTRQRWLRILPTIRKTTLAIAPLFGQADSVGTIVLDGTLDSGDVQPFTVQLEITPPAELLDYQGGTALPVVVECNGESYVVQASVAIKPDRYSIVWTHIPTGRPCRWHLEIPVLFLYALQPIGSVRAVAALGECYEQVSTEVPVSVAVVCGHPLRAVQLGNATLQMVAPNPFGEVLELHVFSQQAQYIRASAYDVVGRKFSLGPEQSLQTGENVIIFDTKGLPGGWYRITIEISAGYRFEYCCLIKH